MKVAITYAACALIAKLSTTGKLRDGSAVYRDADVLIELEQDTYDRVMEKALAGETFSEALVRLLGKQRTVN